VREESREGSCQGLRAEPAVEPEGGAAAITQHNRGDQPEMREFLVDDASLEGGGFAVTKIGREVALEPSLPRDDVRPQKLMNEFH